MPQRRGVAGVWTGSREFEIPRRAGIPPLPAPSSKESVFRAPAGTAPRSLEEGP
jgi:hypothetical protein